MIRRAGFALTVVALLLGLSGGIAEAHVLKTDGSIGGTLHIEPDDNPSTGQPTTYVISFTNDAGSFNLQHCDCMVNIQEAGKTIYSHALQLTNSTNSVNRYTFQKPDVYNLQFTGRPTTPGEFQPFTLNYLVRVTGSGSTATQPFPPLLWPGLAMAVGLLILGAYATGKSDVIDHTRN